MNLEKIQNQMKQTLKSELEDQANELEEKIDDLEKRVSELENHLDLN